MYTTLNESIFLKQHLQLNYRVLEYGSGESTIEIAKLTKEVISIEHVKKFADKIQNKNIQNVTIVYCPPNLPYVEGTQCGDYETFKDYIESPKNYGLFDCVFIDGRARVECAKFIKQIARNNCKIFIHDFFSRLNSDNYKEILNYLKYVSHVEDMCLFKLK